MSLGSRGSEVGAVGAKWEPWEQSQRLETKYLAAFRFGVTWRAELVMGLGP